MIIFYGELSNKCKSYRLKIEARAGLISALIPGLLLTTLIVTAMVLWDWIFSVALIAIVLFVVLAYIVPIKKGGNLIFPEKVLISQNILESSSKHFYEKRSIKDVKKVIDMGEWYQICFYFPHKTSRFICEKNLIIEGSLVEFENLFQSKIIRKN